MDRETFEALGDKCKAFESRQAQTLLPGVPFMARLDGRAFHTFTRGLQKPYDRRFSALMWETTRTLIQHYKPLLGYTQSDEITLYWEPTMDMPFGGRVSKLESTLAGMASAVFNKVLPELLPEKAEALPHFDCRVWSVPDWQTAYETFAWREEDATRNSLSMLCQATFSHKELQGKNRKAQHDMLHEKGMNWNNEPHWFKRGEYFARVARQRPLTEEELARIPAGKPRPEYVCRTEVEALGLDPILSLDPLILLLQTRVNQSTFPEGGTFNA